MRMGTSKKDKTRERELEREFCGLDDSLTKNEMKMRLISVKSGLYITIAAGISAASALLPA